VRREIERALERPDVHVIPVLVDGARMPGEGELPGGLRALARRNACELTDARWEYDIGVLCQRLRRVLGESTLDQIPPAHPEPERDSAPPDATVPSGSVAVPVLATLAAAAVAGFAAAVLSKPLAGQGEPQWGRLAGYAIERGVIWAIIGAGAAAVAAATFGRSRVPLGAALYGAGAGWLGGAAGGAGYMAMKFFGGVTERDAHWLLLLPTLVLPGLLLAAVLARAADARAGECRLAAVAGAMVAALLSGDNRMLGVTLGAVLVVGAVVAVVAVVAVSPHRAPLSRRVAASRRATAT